MKTSVQLHDVWLKAAILGSVWAASEIILGSFLHNLRIPFNGNILTAIAIILLIGVSYRWQDKGLFWRTALICALMKTMSPSAVIFGPMIAIFVEGVILDISVRILGRNVIGFLVGASLAMSWILFQKIANFVIMYGFDFVKIYQQIMGFAQKQLHINVDMVWLPIIVLLFLYIILGGIAVYLGMKIGKNLQFQTINISEFQNLKTSDYQQKTSNFNYSVYWLLFNFVMLVTMLFVINKTSYKVWIPATLLIVWLWVNRYKRGLRQLSKPSFLIFFVLITMVTSFVITYIQGNQNQWFQGFMIGVQMNFRAAIVIVGFAVLGTELYNPVIRNYFSKTAFRQLPLALELAFESLPLVISRLPDVKTYLKNPTKVIEQLIYFAEKRFETLKNPSKIFIITGEKGQGKSTLIATLTKLLKKDNFNVKGFYATRIVTNNQTTGYDLVDISTAQQFSFLRIEPNEPTDIGKFTANQVALQHFEKQYITHFNFDTILMIDEIGLWEVQEKGWYNIIKNAVNQPIKQVWVVRKSVLNLIIEKFNLHHSNIIDLSNTTLEDATNLITNEIHPQNFH